MIFYAATAWAEFDVDNGIAIEGQYNDNIFLSSSGEEDDFITTVMPRIILIYKSPKSVDLSLDYGLHFRYYNSHSELNETDIKETQRVALDLQIRPVKRVYVDIEDIYERVPVDIRENNVDNSSYNMTDRNIFTVTPYIVIPLKKSASLKAGYRYIDTWYRDDESVDSYINAVYCSLNKKITRKLNGLINYEYSVYRPEVNDDERFDEYDRQQASLEFAYQMTGKLRLNGEAGEIWTDFDEKDDDENFFWHAGFDYFLRDERMTVVNAGYSRTFYDSAIDGSYEENIVDIYIETGRNAKLSINTFYSEDEYINVDRKDKVGGIGIDVLKPLSGKIDINAGADWQEERFREMSEYEKAYRYSMQAGIEYDMSRYLTTSIRYRYNSRDSDFNSKDFNNNVVSINARAAF